jgi:hypothetical protein
MNSKLEPLTSCERGPAYGPLAGAVIDRGDLQSAVEITGDVW